MDKQRIAVIGAGGCGNKLLNTLMDIDPRYTPVFCNTNIREMENLEHFDAGNNSLYFANAGGTGRDRDKAQEAIKKEQPKTIDFLANRFSPTSGLDTFFLMGSSDGGTGSGSIPILAKAIKLVNPDATVNVLAAMSGLNERESSLKNTKGFWNDMVTLMKDGVINSVQFIDNNKMVDEEEFNMAVMSEFDKSISIDNEGIDIIDSERVNTARGYKITLNLDSRLARLDVKKAIKQAKESSNFLITELNENGTFECDFAMVSVDSESGIDKNSFKGFFEVYDLDKYDYNDEGKNMIVLGGVELPKDYIELIDMELATLKEKRSNRDIFSDDLIVENDVKVKTTPKKKKAMSRKQLNNLMKNTNLWD